MLNGNGLGRRWMVVLQIVSVVAAVLLAYATMSARLAVAESQIDSMRHDLDNLRNYIRMMEERRR
jgi:cell division protein FtsL